MGTSMRVAASEAAQFPEFISRERERLRAEREQVFTEQKELQRRLDAISREFAAIEAYATAKTGKAARQAPAGRQPRARTAAAGGRLYLGSPHDPSKIVR